MSCSSRQSLLLTLLFCSGFSPPEFPPWREDGASARPQHQSSSGPILATAIEQKLLRRDESRRMSLPDLYMGCTETQLNQLKVGKLKAGGTTTEFDILMGELDKKLAVADARMAVQNGSPAAAKGSTNDDTSAAEHVSEAPEQGAEPAEHVGAEAGEEEEEEGVEEGAAAFVETGSLADDVEDRTTSQEGPSGRRTTTNHRGRVVDHDEADYGDGAGRGVEKTRRTGAGGKVGYRGGGSSVFIELDGKVQESSGGHARSAPEDSLRSAHAARHRSSSNRVLSTRRDETESSMESPTGLAPASSLQLREGIQDRVLREEENTRHKRLSNSAAGAQLEANASNRKLLEEAAQIKGCMESIVTGVKKSKNVRTPVDMRLRSKVQEREADWQVGVVLDWTSS